MFSESAVAASKDSHAPFSLPWWRGEYEDQQESMSCGIYRLLLPWADALLELVLWPNSTSHLAYWNKQHGGSNQLNDPCTAPSFNLHCLLPMNGFVAWCFVFYSHQPIVLSFCRIIMSKLTWSIHNPCFKTQKSRKVPAPLFFSVAEPSWINNILKFLGLPSARCWSKNHFMGRLLFLIVTIGKPSTLNYLLHFICISSICACLFLNQIN